MNDAHGREYARLSQLRPGDSVQVDDGFEGCFLPWSKLTVVEVGGDLALIHNVPECGACGGGTNDKCPHTLDGQLMDDGDSLTGVYKI